MTTLVDKILAVAEAFDRADVPWAFGGAFALAYATAEPRGTRDIDVNVFVRASAVDVVFNALPEGVVVGHESRHEVLTSDQVRVMWDDTPIDLFFVASDFHHDVGERCRQVPFAGRSVTILCAEDLAVFKALFDRPKDWVDIDAMAGAGTLNRAVASNRLAQIVGDREPRVDRLRTGRS